MKITLAHSPDADDAFMFYPLFAGKIDTQGLEFEEGREDIETLNRKAEEGVFDVTAISLHVFPSIQDRYLLLPVGGCFGDKYGPVLVSHKPLKPRQVLRLRVAIPGKRTTAFLILKLWERVVAGEGKSGLSYTEVPFDKIMDLVAEKKMDLGLLIHEGQLTFQEKGLFKVVDLGEWWHKETSLPLPLGAIAVRRQLDWETQKKVAAILRESVRYALEHKEEAVNAALPFARGLDAERAGQFIGMYVNETTIDWGHKGFKAVKTLFDKGFASGIITERVYLDEAVFDFKMPPSVPVPPIQESGVKEPSSEEPSSGAAPSPDSDSEKLPG